ncbi:hypothetical protein BD413DRAFT_609715 [Trametes elegans]|nr:hypothetical protein BD413DRAFT_609715 [Trametes elegans]
MATASSQVINLTAAPGSASTTPQISNPGPISPGSGSSPSFTFTELPYTNTCASETIVWNYDGPAQTFTFRAAPISPSPQPKSGPSVYISLLVADNLDITPGNGSFSWNPVNLTAGAYIMHAIGAGSSFSAQSAPFLVDNGTDTSCLAPLTTGAGAVASPAPSAASNLTAHSDMNDGAIAGVVIAALVVLLAAFAAFAYFRLGWCRRAGAGSRRVRSWRNEKGAPAGGWLVLSPQDSRRAGGRDELPTYSSQFPMNAGPPLSRSDKVPAGALPSLADAPAAAGSPPVSRSGSLRKPVPPMDPFDEERAAVDGDLYPPSRRVRDSDSVTLARSFFEDDEEPTAPRSFQGMKPMHRLVADVPAQPAK